ncbi:MAG: class I SAM-dependent methyltransferase [bacterium]
MGTVRIIMLLLLCIVTTQIALSEPILVPSPDKYTREAALKFEKTSATVLAPAYDPLAGWIVSKFDLAEKEGIGIDLGGGPGTLIICLCKRTQRIHWINADINPHYFPLFFKAAKEVGVEGRISAVFADAQAMPFRDNYADIIVSRGSFQFWKDKRLGFSEVYRVLKPGGVAFIGRGFSENLAVETAREVREKHRKGGKVPKYDVPETEQELRGIMKALDIEEYTIHIPKPPDGDDVNYGIWLEFHKGAEVSPAQSQH